MAESARWNLPALSLHWSIPKEREHQSPHLLPKPRVQTWGRLEGKVTTAENSDSVQSIKPQPLSPQRRSCSSQPVKVASKLNGLLLIWLLMFFPPAACVCMHLHTATHTSTHPPTLPAQGEAMKVSWSHAPCVALSQLPNCEQCSLLGT